MNTVFLSLGANLGNREQTLRQAIEMLEQRVGSLIRCSSFYYSEPWGFASEHSFCNVCASFRTLLSPMELLQETQAIERALGREQGTKSSKGSKGSKSSNSSKGFNGSKGVDCMCDIGELPVYHDRTIDIDILQYFDNEGVEVRLETEALTLPHPFMKVRDFVMVPLREIMYPQGKEEICTERI